MTVSSWEQLYQQLMWARRVEDVFGPLPASSDADYVTTLKQRYRALARLVHPDRHVHDAAQRVRAEAAFKQLTLWYERASAAVSPSQPREPVTLDTRHFRYALDEVLAEGDLSTLYRARATSRVGDQGVREVVIKIVDAPEDNDLMHVERRVLKRLHAAPRAPQTKHLPQRMDHFTTSAGQLATVFDAIDGVDLCSLREAYPQGVPLEHVMWIYQRALSAVGYAHSRGVLHGNLDPTHVMVRPRDHNVFVIDWCYAVVEPARTGQRFRCFNPLTSPPEVEARRPPLPASDLYALARCMGYALGGELALHGEAFEASLPEEVDARFRGFLKSMLRVSPLQRTQDAWRAYRQLGALRREIDGEPVFRVLTL